MKNHGRLYSAGMVFAAFFAGAVFCWAIEQAPVSAEFQQHQAQLGARTLTAGASGGHALGYVPHPVKLPAPAASLPKAAPKALPSSYDLRTYGKVTPVKDQGNYGNCWTFATFGSMESCLLTAETWDFSENNLANLHGLDNGYGDGGNIYMSLAYLGRWSGPVLESDDPYSNGPNSPAGLSVQKHVQNAVFIPDRTSATDNDAIKQAIMTYGAIYSTICWDNNAYESATCAFYNPSTNYSNHAITIIGWDDSYSSSNFGTTPAGNGAFLVKNSWGTSWGNAGYFWVSYYDYRIGQNNGLFLNAEATSNYESVYQYDNLGYCTSFGFGNTTACGANIFSGSSGTIKAVGFYMMAAGGSYEIKVYTSGSEGNPASGTLSATKSGSVTCAGYYTVALDSPVTFSGRFSVVVKFTTPGFNYPIPVEYRMSGYSSAATASAGESYISADGSSWDAAEDNGLYFNICIKAFGTGGSVGPTPPEPVSSGTPLLGDYDGDRYGDPVFYRSSSVWNFLLSRLNYGHYSFQFGGSGYEAKCGDFDGDGLKDPTLYEEASGYWHMMCSRRGYNLYYIAQSWGAPGCTMLAADYDGDRYSDPMVYQESSGYWYILASTYGYRYPYFFINWWGASGCTGISDDFDGDRFADLMAYQRSTGNWYILLSSTGDKYYYIISGFGGSSYTPVVGDFDGDMRADLVVHNTSTFYWYILLSCTGWHSSIAFKWDSGASVAGNWMVIGDASQGPVVQKDIRQVCSE